MLIVKIKTYHQLYFISVLLINSTHQQRDNSITLIYEPNEY